MTFDDGILTVYRTENTAKPARSPCRKLRSKESIILIMENWGITEFTGAKAGGTAG